MVELSESEHSEEPRYSNDDVVIYPGAELELTPEIKKQTAVLTPQNVTEAEQ